MHGLIESTVGPALWVDFLHELGSRMDPPAASGSASRGSPSGHGGCARRELAGGRTADLPHTAHAPGPAPGGTGSL